MADRNTSYNQNTSFYDQFTGAGSSAPGSIESFRGDINSALSSISKGLNLSGFTNKISSLGAISTAQKFTSVSKFKDNFGSLYPIPGPNPEEVRDNITKPPKGLQYPEDITEYFITFHFFNSKQSTPITPRVKLPTVNISLPIPSNLTENFNMQYADKQLGLLGILEDTGILKSDTVATLFDGKNSEQALSDLSKKGEALGSTLVSPSGAFTAARGLANLSDTLGAGIDRATGSVLNPHQALQFEGVSLRKHSFTFRLAPASQKESIILKEIIREFKIRMHPEKTVLAFNFPDECNISINTPSGSFDTYYKFKACYLESMTVNYSPAGTPAFFAGGNHPTEIEIQLNFGEIEPLTRQDYADSQYNKDYKDQLPTKSGS